MSDDLFKNKYRISSARLRGWDYSWNGYYFVTICVKGSECVFGNVENGETVLSRIGEIVNQCWQEIPRHFSFVQLDEFVIMPNHVHGIIIINNNVVETLHATSLRHAMSLHKSNIRDSKSFSNISPKQGSLSSVIRSFKSAVTKLVNNELPHQFFAWQPRFYDRIIRDEKELWNVRNYIRNNPLKWEEDEENPLKSQ